MHGLLRPELEMNRIHFLKLSWPNKSQVQLSSGDRETDAIPSWEELQSYIARGHGFTEGHNPDPFCKISNVSVFRGVDHYSFASPSRSSALLSPFLFKASLSLYGFLLLCSATVSSETIWSIRFYTATSLSV